MGEKAKHNLKDVYRQYLNNNPEIFDEIKKRRPTGPLAISYNLGKKNKPVYCRYDFIYATPDFTAESVDYLYHESLEAGSDHSLIIAKLKI